MGLGWGCGQSRPFWLALDLKRAELPLAASAYGSTGSQRSTCTRSQAGKTALNADGTVLLVHMSLCGQK